MDKKLFKNIYIEITNCCNLECKFCPKTRRPLKFMTLDEFEKVVKEVNKYTDYIYLHVKGEPLLYDNLDGIFKLCKKYSLKV